MIKVTPDRESHKNQDSSSKYECDHYVIDDDDLQEFECTSFWRKREVCVRSINDCSGNLIKHSSAFFEDKE